MWKLNISKNVFFWILLISICRSSLTLEIFNEDKTCSAGFFNEVAYCKDFNMKEIPSDLTSFLRILDVSDNKLSEIKHSSFVNYPSLEELYLSHNSIENIESEAFNPTACALEVLDLSRNELKYFSPSIFKLPMLKKLLVADNNLQDPIDIRNMSKLCSLETLDLRNNPHLFENNFCKCKVFEKWIVDKSIQLYPEPADLCVGLLEGNSVIQDPEICFTNETDFLFEESKRMTLDCEIIAKAVKRCRKIAFSVYLGAAIFQTFVVAFSGLRLIMIWRGEQKESNSKNESKKSYVWELNLLLCFSTMFQFFPSYLIKWLIEWSD